MDSDQQLYIVVVDPLDFSKMRSYLIHSPPGVVPQNFLIQNLVPFTSSLYYFVTFIEGSGFYGLIPKGNPIYYTAQYISVNNGSMPSIISGSCKSILNESFFLVTDSHSHISSLYLVDSNNHTHSRAIPFSSGGFSKFIKKL